jgi:hypothetical protein
MIWLYHKHHSQLSAKQDEHQLVGNCPSESHIHTRSAILNCLLQEQVCRYLDIRCIRLHKFMTKRIPSIDGDNPGPRFYHELKGFSD